MTELYEVVNLWMTPGFDSRAVHQGKNETNTGDPKN